MSQQHYRQPHQHLLTRQSIADTYATGRLTTPCAMLTLFLLISLMLPSFVQGHAPLRLTRDSPGSKRDTTVPVDVSAGRRETDKYWQRRLARPATTLHTYTWLSRLTQWRQLEVMNCYSDSLPKDILTAEEVHAHEKAIQKAAEKQLYQRRTQRILRLQHLQWLSHREFLASFGDKSSRRIRRENTGAFTAKALTPATNTPPTEPTIEDLLTSTEIHNISKSSTEHINSTAASTTTTLESAHEVSTENPQQGAVATLHRLAIRSKTVLVTGGVLRARLKYLIQLHRAIVGPHKLVVEVRLDKKFPPIYTGTVEDVCTYWPANAPGSECSLRKRRFYQKGRICLCHMPPGLYHQRLKLNFGDVFEGAQISPVLINVLFYGQHLNLYVTVMLTSADNTTVACTQAKIPVSFAS